MKILKYELHISYTNYFVDCPSGQTLKSVCICCYPKRAYKTWEMNNIFIHFMVDIKTDLYIQKQRLLDGLNWSRQQLLETQDTFVNGGMHATINFERHRQRSGWIFKNLPYIFYIIRTKQQCYNLSRIIMDK
jgi:hypothetical protein